MTMIPPSGPVVRVKPQPNVYTLLLIIAIVVLLVAIGVVVNNLMTAYGLSFGELFTGQPAPAL